MVKWLRFTLIGLALVSVLLVLLPAGGTAYLNSPRGQQLIRDRINRMIQGEISWKKLELSLYSGGIEIQDLLVTGPDRRLLAGAEQVRANLAMLWLPAGRISLENLELQKPRIALARDNQGRWPLAEAFSRPGPRNDSSAPLVNPRIDLSIDTFLASGGSLDFSDSPSAIAVSMDEVSIWGEDLRLSTPAGKIRLEIGRGGIEAPGFNAPIDRLNLTANLEAERLAPVEVDLALGDSSFRLAGSVERLSAEPWIEIGRAHV